MCIRALFEEVEKLRAHTKALVELRIRALYMRAELDQVGRLLVDRQCFANLLRSRGLFFGRDLIRKPANGTQERRSLDSVRSRQGRGKESNGRPECRGRHRKSAR